MEEIEFDPNFDLDYFDLLYEASGYFIDGDSSYVDKLLPDIIAKKCYNETPVLFYLIDYVEVLEYLKSKNIDFFQKDPVTGGGLLHYAVLHSEDDVFAWILQLYAEHGDVEDSNNKGITALMVALKFGIISRAKMLIDHGASTTSKGIYDLTPLRQAFLCVEGEDKAIEGLELIFSTGDFSSEILGLIENAEQLKMPKVLAWLKQHA